MKIVSNFLFNKTNLYNVNSVNNTNYHNNFYPNLKPLASDVVSFGGGHKIIKAAFESDYTSKLPMLKEKGEKLLRVIEECCAEVEGATFDREYCEKSVNKSLERYIEKFADKGSKPMDTIRTSPFIMDLYNFSIISNFIKALEKRGFYILPIPDKTAGKKVLSWKPDFDIRLNDDEGKLVSPDEIKKLPTYLRGYVSKRQKSGYKDIQMRVVDASDLPKDKRNNRNLSHLVPEELIFIFGKATANAKTEESRYIYNITRKLDKMHILDVNRDINGIYKIRENIQGIGSILRSNISKPLYRNAEKLDVYPNEKHILEDIHLDEKQCNILKAYISELKTRTSSVYAKLHHLIKSPEFDIEIEKMIKATHEYKIRPNKRVSDEEIRIKRSELLKEMREHRTDDMNTISEQMQNMDETIQKYCIKDVDLKTKLEEKIANLDANLGQILSDNSTLGRYEVTQMRKIQAQKNKLKEQLSKLEA